MAIARYICHQKQKDGSYNDVYFKTESGLVYRPNGRTVEQDLNAYLPDYANSDIVPNITNGKIAVGSSKVWYKGGNNATHEVSVVGHTHVKTDVTDFSHHHPITDIDTTSNANFVTDAERTWWNSKAEGSHIHQPSDVLTNANNRFVTDTEKSTWNNKANASHGTHVSYSNTAPVMDGTASVGSAGTVARSDHRHPVDTSRAPANHNHDAGNITSGALSSDRLPVVPVNKGGTGATTAASARSKLGAAASSHTHGASDINQDATHRFVSDTEKSAWNGKANSSHTHTASDISGITQYVHPSACQCDANSILRGLNPLENILMAGQKSTATFNEYIDSNNILKYIPGHFALLPTSYTWQNINNTLPNIDTTNNSQFYNYISAGCSDFYGGVFHGNSRTLNIRGCNSKISSGLTTPFLFYLVYKTLFGTIYPAINKYFGDIYVTINASRATKLPGTSAYFSSDCIDVTTIYGNHGFFTGNLKKLPYTFCINDTDEDISYFGVIVNVSQSDELSIMDLWFTVTIDDVKYPAYFDDIAYMYIA